MSKIFENNLKFLQDQDLKQRILNLKSSKYIINGGGGFTICKSF